LLCRCGTVRPLRGLSKVVAGQQPAGRAALSATYTDGTPDPTTEATASSVILVRRCWFWCARQTRLDQVQLVVGKFLPPPEHDRVERGS